MKKLDIGKELDKNVKNANKFFSHLGKFEIL